MTFWLSGNSPSHKTRQMIKFFRKIRQRLLAENKFSKYLLYALGEIVLVVIGILIALQLNLFNEKQKNEKTEVAYLKGILTDLDQDIYEVNELMYYDTILFNSYTLILRAFTDKSINVYSSSFMKALNYAYIYNPFEGNSTVFEDMKSSGRINFIQSDALRLSILRYYNDSQEIIKMQNEVNGPQIAELKNDAYLNNIDMNSLIEVFIFPDKWTAEIDNLDLSFFQKDIKSQEVKKFANNISVMKGLVLASSSFNELLLYNSKDLKTKIIDYLNSLGEEIENELSDEIVQAIQNGDTDILERTVT